MANEIYNSTWWGNTIDTASSIGTSTEMIQGQFNLTKTGEELVTNGDFATDSDWIKGTGWTISGGKAERLVAAPSSDLIQSNVLWNFASTFKISFDVEATAGFVRARIGQTNLNYVGQGTHTFYAIPSGNDQLKFQADSSFIGSIDNVSIKEVRASSVEAVKCLADAIHRIGIQNIQN